MSILKFINPYIVDHWTNPDRTTQEIQSAANHLNKEMRAGILPMSEKYLAELLLLKISLQGKLEMELEDQTTQDQPTQDSPN